MAPTIRPGRYSTTLTDTSGISKMCAARKEASVHFDGRSDSIEPPEPEEKRQQACIATRTSFDGNTKEPLAREEPTVAL